jgi:dihydrofolate reductase
MSKVTLYIATSLDGYIARNNGDIDWLSRVDTEQEDYGYGAFYQSVDAIVMGRSTYEAVLKFDEWPYSGKQTFVLTQRHLTSDRNDVVFLSDRVDTALFHISAQGFRHLWLVGGGVLVNAFLQHNAIDEYIISTIPIILGEGIRLFPSSSPEIALELIGSQHYPSGLLQAHYRRKGESGLES